jgi:hypothetical protein
MGEDRLRVWRPDDGREKWFCGDGGSHVFARNPSHAGPIGIRMGTFEEDPGVPSERASVREVCGAMGADPGHGLPRHPEGRHTIG